MRVQRPEEKSDYSYVDSPETRARLVDFADGETTRVTFRVEGIHCVACVWLLENLPRLNPEIRSARVNFSTREVNVCFASDRLKLSELVSLLASIGYEPELKLEQLEDTAPRPTHRRLWLQLGVAGFAFGNTMLFSLSSYLGLDEFHGQTLAAIFAWFSFALAIPVLVFSASDYWRSAWVGLQQRRLTIEVPIAIGLVALFGQSTYEIVSKTGEGFFDSLTGLVFFLLIGRVFQRKTYDRLSFDRDYKSFFPLAACRRVDEIEERVALSEIKNGDQLVVRNGELIPADGDLVEGAGLIDYSFVTGEAAPVARVAGEHVYAGGRQMGGAIEVTTVKPVSQSYLTSLWNQDAFNRDGADGFESITNRFSPWFTGAVILIALASAIHWWSADAGRALHAFAAVLIVACPCALALAAPFALGTAQRILGAAKVYLKNPAILERLARIDTVVFDKTGTLTHEGIGGIEFVGPELSATEKQQLRSLAEQSTHPYASRIAKEFADHHSINRILGFQEIAGKGMSGVLGADEMQVGSANWLTSIGIAVPSENRRAAVHMAIGGIYRGAFFIHNPVRDRIGELAGRLRGKVGLALLSGDNDREAETFGALLGNEAALHFSQSPQDKLNFVRRLQDEGKSVMMVGDGLNDAGALKQSDVGVAVVENTNRFSPASDLILDAGEVARMDDLLAYAKTSVNVVRFSLFISVLYNVVGLSFAARGILSPVICAILMPVSSITVVAMASGLSAWFGRRWSFRLSVSSEPTAHAETADTLKRELQLEGGLA